MRNHKSIKPALSQKWNAGFYKQMQVLLKQSIPMNRRRVLSITDGRTMPEPVRVSIGSAKRMTASVLFFDLADFTATSSRLAQEQTLYMLNLIIPTMMRIVRHWNGEIEKNTGDGIMAIFGTETRDYTSIARDSVEAAMAMRFVMINDVQGNLSDRGLPSMNFRIGIEMGELLIARIGVPSNNFLTAVGDAANRASKLQSLAMDNGICIGEDMALNLHPELHPYCLEGQSQDWSWKREG